ncbi:MAG: SRPBCC domain-containing protein [Myxococcales bacterium]|nr:SRPBCC domain-containing protein [Myxococcales bacterium]
MSELVVEPLGERAIRMERTFRASRERVFEAYVRPELVRRWLGTSRMDWHTCTIDARVGGGFRYLWTRGDFRMGIQGVFVVLEPPARIVHRERFDGSDGETLVTTLFHDEGGLTRVETVLEYGSTEARDRVLATPMRDGISEGYVLLDAVLAG